MNYTTENGVRIVGDERLAENLLLEDAPVVGKDAAGHWFTLSLSPAGGIVATPEKPIEFDDITSGLGIGGAGSDDYNINTEQPTPHIPTGKPRRNGGGQLWEPCPRCGEEPVHVDCGYCDRHCQC